MAAPTPIFRPLLGLALIAVLVALAATAHPADAAVRTFHPHRQAAHSVTFKLRGVNPLRVQRAKLKIRKHHRTVTRKINPKRVRHAIAKGKEIRVTIGGGESSGGGSGSSTPAGELVIGIAPPKPPAPTPQPETENAGCGPGATTFALSTTSRTPSPCWRPYAAASPFNTKVSAGTPALGNSQGIIENWLSTWSTAEKTSAPRFSAPTANSEEDYNHPIYFADESDPLYTIHCTEPWGTCPIEGKTVHIPAGAQAASGSDGHMAVIEAATGWEYDFWQAGSKPAAGGELDISWGGRTRVDGSGLGSPATAGNFGLAAGVIRPEELAAGRIEHALFMVVKCTNGTAVYPAGSDTGRSCSSIGLSNQNAPAMGQHFVLNMSVAEIEALPDPGWQKTVLRAMAEYGLYVGDTGGGFLKVESGVSFTSMGMGDPWTSLASRVTTAARAASTTSGLAISPECINFEMSEAVDWRSKLEVVSP